MAFLKKAGAVEDAPKEFRFCTVEPGSKEKCNTMLPNQTQCKGRVTKFVTYSDKEGGTNFCEPHFQIALFKARGLGYEDVEIKSEEEKGA